MKLTQSVRWAITDAARFKLPPRWGTSFYLSRTYPVYGLGGSVEAQCHVCIEDGISLRAHVLANHSARESARFWRFHGGIERRLLKLGYRGRDLSFPGE